MNNHAENVLKKVLGWVESMREKDGVYGMYRYARSSPGPDLYGSCFAAMLRYLTGDLANLSGNQKDEWIKLIQSWQEDSGLILDPQYYSWVGRRSPEEARMWDSEYISYEMTATAISALDVFGATAMKPFEFFKPNLNPESIREYLQSRNWQQPWMEGNKILNFGIFLIKNYESNRCSKECIDAFFDTLDSLLDPRTGFWGTDKGASVFDGMGGAMHEYMLYFYCGRKIKYAEAVVDSTLSLQQEDGLFEPSGGGTQCADLDAVILLAGMYLMNDYRRNEIQKTLKRVYDAIFALGLWNKDGGFKSNAHHTSDRTFRRNGLPYVSNNGGESDMLSTFFRLGTIYLISRVIDTPFSSYPWLVNKNSLYWYWLPERYIEQKHEEHN